MIAWSLSLRFLLSISHLRPLMPPVDHIRVLVVNVLPDGAEDVVPLRVRWQVGLLGYEIDRIAKEQLEIDEVSDLDGRRYLVINTMIRCMSGHGYLVARNQRESRSGATSAGNPSDSMYEEFGLARKVEIDNIVLVAGLTELKGFCIEFITLLSENM